MENVVCVRMHVCAHTYTHTCTHRGVLKGIVYDLKQNGWT